MVEGGDRLERGIRAIREHVELDWEAGRVHRLLTRTKARQRRRTVVRATLAAAAVVALAAAGALSMRGPGSPAEEPATVAEPTPRPTQGIHLADGSRVTPLDDDTEVVVVRVSEDEILLDLVRGAARFEVVPGLERAFGVRAGDVEVAVVGTVFEVVREGQEATVRVLEGRVRVAWPPDGEIFLGVGEEGRFPRPVSGARTAGARGAAPAPEPAPAPQAVAARPRPVREPPAAAEPPSRPAWVELAERGEYEEARRLLEEAGGVVDSRDLDVLLLASDTMRLTGKPGEALVLLDRATTLAEGDARAPLVAFTRGRLLLTGLRRPADAAEDFARARSLAPEGSLAMDAMAREVEALARAGDAERARERAEEYVRRHPNGLRLDAVRRWGGLADP